MREAGRRGGLRTSARHGRAHYRKIGSKGGQKLRQLVETGKKLERDHHA